MIEETGEAKDGVEFLKKTREDWTKVPFQGHIVWHLTLYYLGESISKSLMGKYHSWYKFGSNITMFCLASI